MMQLITLTKLVFVRVDMQHFFKPNHSLESTFAVRFTIETMWFMRSVLGQSTIWSLSYYHNFVFDHCVHVVVLLCCCVVGFSVPNGRYTFQVTVRTSKLKIITVDCFSHMPHIVCFQFCRYILLFNIQNFIRSHDVLPVTQSIRMFRHHNEF